MNRERESGKRPNEAKEISVRLSHLLRHCSVGAIVRDSDALMVVPDIRRWYKPGDDPMARQIRYVDQVRSALGIDQALCTPPVARKLDNGRMVGWIPVRRFPLWMRCLQCGLLHRAPWRDRPDDSDIRCPGREGRGCGGRLEQVPWVLVHECGYLADVPWHDLAHPASVRDPSQRQCKRDWKTPYLKFVERDRRRISCARCGASGGLPQQYHLARNTWQQPWIHEPPADPPEEPAWWLLEINDVRVHATVTPTALVIPPESRIGRGTIVDRLYGSSRNQRRIRTAKTRLARRNAVNRIAGDYGCHPDEIDAALRAIKCGYPLYGQTITEGELLVSEYRALTEKIPNLMEDEDFVTEHHTDDWKNHVDSLDAGLVKQIGSTVSRLVSVRKLKEIMVLKGFRRMVGNKYLTPPDISGESGWLPALELYGEGIFFTIDEELLGRWERHEALCRRADEARRRYERRDFLMEEGEVSPRFLLCHTLGHILVRRLEAEAGYPAASLKERIYCATDKVSPMAGILIYVAVADEEGSLGGLMELAEPGRFLRLLVGVFETAQWCSLDPVCSEQEGHGPDLLNRAACHACALVPETSCAYGNVLLDRIFIRGADDIPALLDFVEMPT